MEVGEETSIICTLTEEVQRQMSNFQNSKFQCQNLKANAKYQNFKKPNVKCPNLIYQGRIIKHN